MLKLNLQFFGGRGSGSWDGGGDSGGSESVGNYTPSSLISERESKPKEVDEVLSAMRQSTSEWGVSVDDVQIAKFDKPSSVLGFFGSDGNLAINSAFFDSNKMNKAYDADVKRGFHPSRGDKSALEAVTAHELGHSVNSKIAGGFGNLDKVAGKIVKEAGTSLGYTKFKEFAGKISGYAKKNNAECVAEAFADVYCNGSKATKESQAVVNAMRKYI